MTLTFYAYWNGPQMADLFTAIAGITSLSGYKLLMCIASLVGLIAVSFMAAIHFRAINIAQWFFATILFFTITFVPKVTLNVYDVRAMSIKSVANVPIGVGFVAAATSGIGKWMAENFEMAFTDVDAAKFSKFGMMFPEKVIDAVNNAGPLLPETKALMSPIIDKCVVPELIEDRAKLTEILTSTDLTKTISTNWVNPARFILYEGVPLYCDDAIIKLKEILKTKEIPHQEKLILSQIGGAGDEMIASQIRKAIPASESLLLGISRTFAEGLSHSIFTQAIPSGILKEASKTNGAMAASIALSKSQGNMASEIGFRSMSELAQSFLPRLRNVLEYILVASFPIVFLIMMAVGIAGIRVLQTYLILFFWLSLWAPLASVINSLLLHLDKEPLTNLINAYGGLTIESASLIRELGASSQAMAGYTMLLIPLISYIIAKGSDIGATSLASSVMNPSQSAALGTSNQTAQGNISFGNLSTSNVSSNNSNLNKSDISTSYASASRRTETYATGSATFDQDKGEMTSIKAESSNLGFNTTVAMTEARSNSIGESNSKSTSFSRGDYEESSFGLNSSYATNSSFSLGESSSESARNSSSKSNVDTRNISTGYSASNNSTFTSSTAISDRGTFKTDVGILAQLPTLAQNNEPNQNRIDPTFDTSRIETSQQTTSSNEEPERRSDSATSSTKESEKQSIMGPIIRTAAQTIASSGIESIIKSKISKEQDEGGDSEETQETSTNEYPLDEEINSLDSRNEVIPHLRSISGTNNHLSRNNAQSKAKSGLPTQNAPQITSIPKPRADLGLSLNSSSMKTDSSQSAQSTNKMQSTAQSLSWTKSKSTSNDLAHTSTQSKNQSNTKNESQNLRDSSGIRSVNQTSSNQSFALSRNENQGITGSVAINKDAQIRDSLAQSGSSTEEILQMLNNPKTRSEVASQSFDSVIKADSSVDKLATPTSDRVTDNQDIVLDKIARATDKINQVSSRIQAKETGKPNLINTPQLSQDSQFDNQSNTMNLEASAATLANFYFRENANPTSLLINSLFAGVSYRSPEELKAQVLEQAQNNEEFKDALLLLGNGAINIEEFHSLMGPLAKYR